MLGTVGVESPCFQLEKALKKLALDAADPEAYAEGTLREKLHGRGPRLPDEHRGASHRIRSSTPTGPAR